MGNYSNTGKQVLFNENGNVEHIADAADNEKAHFLAAVANGHSRRFIGDALRTLSPAWHGDKVALNQLKGRINGAIDAINKLDQLKKTLFYGRDNNLIADGQHDSMGIPDSMVMPGGANAANIFHAILGKVTEAGELLEALKACYNGKEVFDRINAIEEVGDGFWYDAILLDECDTDFEDAMRRVINKLRQRFPDKFAEVNANERDLAAERAVLEDRREPLLDEAIDPEDPRKHHVARGIDLVDDEAAATYYPAIAGEADFIAPTQPVGGKPAVERAAESAAKAFDAVSNVGSEAEPPIVPTSDLDGELAKSVAERLHPLPQEHMAQTNSGKRD